MSQARPSGAPPPGLRELNREARRQRILAAARQLLARGGVAALSMRKLAREAGLSVTTLYNLFGAREDILVALIADAIDRMDERLERDAPLADPFERCRSVITVSIQYLVEHQAIFRPMVIASYQGLSHGSIGDRRISERAAGMQRVAIEAAIEQGLLRDTLAPDALGRQIFHGYELAYVQWAFGAISEAEFRARSLYGLWVALLGVCRPKLRPQIEEELRALERELATCLERSRHAARSTA